MCKKQTLVSHSFTESENISLDAGRRMDGLLALFMGRGDRSVTFIEQYQTTNQSLSRKLFALTQIQPQTKGNPRC